jgi:hypothetical protein
MDERREWKSVSNEEGRKRYKRVNNELRRPTEKEKLEHLESKCDEITELRRKGRCDLMYRKAKELVRKENKGFEPLASSSSSSLPPFGHTSRKRRHPLSLILGCI